ncbi:hypothetical protein F5Y14DRAFT_55635 [Nemania sp. NC0429]|nr:hypothetical protein F5Y14DRAFT_55635 [Nemania sp. NC0429]
MPPPPPSLPHRTPAQRESPFQHIGRSAAAATIHTFHAAPRSIVSKDAAGRLPDRLVGSHEPLNGWEITGTVVGGLVGAVILFGILYYCWEHCRPGATYYETAVQISKKEAECRQRKRERCAQYPSRRVVSSRCVHPCAYLDELAAPAATKARFNEEQIHHWEV